MLRVMDLEERLNREIDGLIAKRQEIKLAVNAVSDEAQREILTRRYLLYQKREVIAEKTSCSERHIRRLHGYTLKNMSLNVRF